MVGFPCFVVNGEVLVQRGFDTGEGDFVFAEEGVPFSFGEVVVNADGAWFPVEKCGFKDEIEQMHFVWEQGV